MVGGPTDRTRASARRAAASARAAALTFRCAAALNGSPARRALGSGTKTFGYITKAMKAFAGMGVKIKVLVSLYQVHNGLGIIFAIPYPETYTSLMSEISAIELPVLDFVPVSCLFGGINFFHVLLVQTAGPIVVIATLEFLAKVFRKMSAKTVAKQAADPSPDDKPPIGAFLADLCSDVSFFLLFLLCTPVATTIRDARDGERKIRALRAHPDHTTFRRRRVGCPVEAHGGHLLGQIEALHASLVRTPPPLLLPERQLPLALEAQPLLPDALVVVTYRR